jgi:hypothetical protein
MNWLLLMLRKLLPPILVNAILSLFFVITNFSIWSELGSGNYLRYINFNLATITDYHVGILGPNNQFNMLSGIVLMFNYPFWLFFVAIAVNLYLIARLAKNRSS